MIQPLQPGERSISAWKTKPVEGSDGRARVQITKADDGNSDLLGRVYEVVRREIGKIIIDLATGYNPTL